MDIVICSFLTTTVFPNSPKLYAAVGKLNTSGMLASQNSLCTFQTSILPNILLSMYHPNAQHYGVTVAF